MPDPKTGLMISEEELNKFVGEASPEEPKPTEPAPPAPPPESETPPPAEPEPAPAPAPTPPKPAFPEYLRAKVQGQEIDIPIFAKDKDGNLIPNPLLVESAQFREDYGRKTQALAEERRRGEAELLQLRDAYQRVQAELEKYQASSLPQLPEDDPYSPLWKHTLSVQKQLQESLGMIAGKINAWEEARQTEANERALQAVETSIRKSYPSMTDEDLYTVEQLWTKRFYAGEPVSLEQVAESYMSRFAQVREQAIEEFKRAHPPKPKVLESAPAAPKPTGEAPPKLTLRDGGVYEAIRSRIEAGEL